MRRAPDFWVTGGWRAVLLSPIAWIWGLVAARRMGRAARARLSVPVVCIGNFVAGGAGKTPTAMAVAAMAQASGRRVLFLSRGYGGTLEGPVMVDPVVHRTRDVGDEPLLLARHAPVIVARDRAGAAAFVEAAIRELAVDLVILDDGFQNPALHRDLSIVVVDAGYGIGNGCVMPAGPLRAPLDVQMARADIVLAIGAGGAADAVLQDAVRCGVRVVRGQLQPDPAASSLSGVSVLGFAGIGRPEKFAETLTGVGARVVEFRAFPDHHDFSAADARELLAVARTQGLLPVTTEKDMVRLASSAEATCLELAALCRTVDVTLQTERRDQLEACLHSFF